MSEEMSQPSRWKWMVLALAPSILSNLLIVAVVILTMNQRTNSPAVAEGGMWLVYGILFMPLAFPIYLYPIARKYVRAFHGGVNSAIPFVLIFSAANLAVWAAGVCVVGFNMKFEGSSSAHVDYRASERMPGHGLELSLASNLTRPVFRSGGETLAMLFYSNPRAYVRKVQGEVIAQSSWTWPTGDRCADDPVVTR